VREVLKVEGFAALPRRLDEERSHILRPTIEAVADARQLSLSPRRFETMCGGLFLFVPSLVALNLEGLAKAAGLPGSKMIPGSHALRSMLALKLGSIERRSHVMPHVADQGLGLLAGLNAIPKRSFLSEYSSRVGHRQIVKLQAAYHKQIDSQVLFPGECTDGLLTTATPQRRLTLGPTTYQIAVVPTVLFFDSGRVVKRVNGMSGVGLSAADLRQALK